MKFKFKGKTYKYGIKLRPKGRTHLKNEVEAAFCEWFWLHVHGPVHIVLG